MHCLFDKQSTDGVKVETLWNSGGHLWAPIHLLHGLAQRRHGRASDNPVRLRNSGPELPTPGSAAATKLYLAATTVVTTSVYRLRVHSCLVVARSHAHREFCERSMLPLNFDDNVFIRRGDSGGARA